MIDLSELNPAQREAVEHVQNPTLVLAGAGSGKTRVLTCKIAHLVSRGVRPWRILAVTFTNKAAREMCVRVENLLHMPARNLWIGTFHGMCVRILRREAENWGFHRNFTIYDDDDRKRIVKKVLKDMNISKHRLPPARAKHIIARAKNDFLLPEDVEDAAFGDDAVLLANVYRRYNVALHEAGAFDFDDLLVQPVEMFRKYPESLKRWQKKFDHILVDEYQDTNRTQYLLMKLLAGDAGKVTVVGDDDQSIYSWRGADINNILGFESDFKRVKTVRLEKNYRSMGNILKAANSVVKHNARRMAKQLYTDQPDGDRITVFDCYSDRDEAERMVNSIEEEQNSHGFTLSDSVILYRTNAQSRSFEDVLRRRAIRYVIVGGTRFYERREIKDILAYLRILDNPRDSVSFARAITTPKRGIGERTIEALEAFAAEKNLTRLEAIARADECLTGAFLNKVHEFHGLIEKLQEVRNESSLPDIARAVVERTRYELSLHAEDPEKVSERMDNIDELVAAMEEFENMTDDDDLSAFLAEVSLVADIDNWDDRSDAVTLMTLHSAKGLEFPSVYIVGVENGLFPLGSSFESAAELEEERRLFYVGITRAKKRLHISYAQSRMRHGTYAGGKSMFVDELPADVLTVKAPAPEFPGLHRRQRPAPQKREFEDYVQEFPDYEGAGTFKIGANVFHPTFGRGKITGSSGSGDRTVLIIQFGGRTRKIMAKFGKLSTP